MSKTKKHKQECVEELFKKTRSLYFNKYYNLFINSVKINNVDAEQEHFIMKELWDKGTIAAFKIKNFGVGFTPYAPQRFNMYDYPVTARLINKYNYPFIPNSELEVNKEVVLGWIQPNHKGIKEIVDYYVDRLTQVEMVINTNLNVHKLPFLIGIDPSDRDRMVALVDRILNNEIVVFTDLSDLERLKSLITSTPYIIDKLYMYRNSLESELMTYLGLDNLETNKKERLLVDEVNANNCVINANREGMLKNINTFFDEINELFGTSISAESLVDESQSVHEEMEEGE